MERGRGLVSVRRGAAELAGIVGELRGEAARGAGTQAPGDAGAGLTDAEARIADALAQCTLRYADASLRPLGMRCVEVVIAGPASAIDAIEAGCDDPGADRLTRDAIARATGAPRARFQLSRVRLIRRA